MKTTEPRPLTTPINRGLGIPNLDYEQIKEMLRFNAEQESIDPRLVKGFGFKISRHLDECLDYTLRNVIKIATNNGAHRTKISLSKAHIGRTALYLYLSFPPKQQEEMLHWFARGGDTYRKTK